MLLDHGRGGVQEPRHLGRRGRAEQPQVAVLPGGDQVDGAADVSPDFSEDLPHIEVEPDLANDTEGTMANADHLVGALALTVMMPEESS